MVTVYQMPRDVTEPKIVRMDQMKQAVVSVKLRLCHGHVESIFWAGL